MDATTLAVIAFVTLTAGMLAIGLLLRDLVWGGQVSAGRTIQPRRIPDVFDQAPATTFWGRLDQEFDRLILESGIDLPPQTAFLLNLASCLLIGGTTYLISGEPLHAVLGGVVGLGGPLFVLAWQRSRRMRMIREELPVMLDMLARATRAGQSVEQAFLLLAHEMQGPLAQEFRRCEQQLMMGRSFDKVLKSLASRIGLVEMRILATTLIVQRQSGGPLSETLERLASVIRDRLVAQRQLLASTAAGRYSSLLVTVISPLAYVGIYVLHRPYLEILFSQPLGRGLFLLALILEVIGIIWVFLLLRREE
ncbi:MAG: hypothetical protein KatS3mg113_0957 [Planctomycetaceae bacterium]|nr:MAG: hypothetical protein KatS3mg113_0957 [Planctomycetaceae bacterium]